MSHRTLSPLDGRLLPTHALDALVAAQKIECEEIRLAWFVGKDKALAVRQEALREAHSLGHVVNSEHVLRRLGEALDRELRGGDVSVDSTGVEPAGPLR